MFFKAIFLIYPRPVQFLLTSNNWIECISKMCNYVFELLGIYFNNRLHKFKCTSQSTKFVALVDILIFITCFLLLAPKKLTIFFQWVFNLSIKLLVNSRKILTTTLLLLRQVLNRLTLKGSFGNPQSQSPFIIGNHCALCCHYVSSVQSENWLMVVDRELPRLK